MHWNKELHKPHKAIKKTPTITNVLLYIEQGGVLLLLRTAWFCLGSEIVSLNEICH